MDNQDYLLALTAELNDLFYTGDELVWREAFHRIEILRNEEQITPMGFCLLVDALMTKTKTGSYETSLMFILGHGNWDIL